MTTPRQFGWLRTAMLVLLCAAPTLTVAAESPETVVWGQNVFVIPYKWSGGSNRAAAREVILYLSKDQGGSWNEVSRARPDVQSFVYRAPKDGEYWFAIRTTDASGASWPSGPMKPALSVVVDTVLPKVNIRRAAISGSGQLEVEADVTDPQLDLTAISVAYQDPTTGVWTAMAATPSPKIGQSTTIRAAAAMPPGASSVSVMIQVKDKAGNPASAGVRANGGRGPLRSTRALPASTGARLRHGPATLPQDPFVNNTAARPPQTFPPQPFVATSPTNQLAASPARSEMWPADNLRRPSLAVPSNIPPQQRPETYRFASSSPSAGLPIAAAKKAGPPTLQVNSDRFELQYELKSVGEWGVSRVEVWGTKDNGQSWRRFAIDIDQRSPVNLQTSGDGLYGFSVIVQSVGGLERRPPTPGDTPDVYVQVDQSKPTATLSGVQQPQGYFADHLVLAWQTSDANLQQKPVSLLYAGKPNGPWLPIASNLDSTGRYSWRLQRHLPSQVYVRLEARDLAGNVGVDQTPKPVSLRLAESSGRIQGVRPLE